MIYVLKLEQIYRITYANVWGPRGSNYSKKKTLRTYVINLSN